MNIVNIASYKFVELDNLEVRRDAFLDFCNSVNIKGTILLAHEGINLILAGERESIKAFKSFLARELCFSDMSYKESVSDAIPFIRMVVKIKPEIVTMGVEEIDPLQKPAPYISPKDLKQWIDEGHDFILLDTRNDYEVQLGTFEGASDFNITSFRAFPDAIEKSSQENKPVVIFCTGGIRCEKAAPFMLQSGFKEVFQLEGGILNYFEECGGEHFHGECFVFDDRIALDSKLHETGTVLCDVCQFPVTAKQQQAQDFLVNRHCSNCRHIIQDDPGQ